MLYLVIISYVFCFVKAFIWQLVNKHCWSITLVYNNSRLCKIRELSNMTALVCHLSFSSILRSNPFYEPKTSSPTRPPVGGPSLDVGSSQKRRAPPPPSSSPGLGPSPSACKPSSVPDMERAQPVGPSPVAAVMGRELASSSPKVTM